MRGFKRAVAFVLMNVVIISLMQLLLDRPSDYEEILDRYAQGDYNSVIIGTSYGENLVPELLPEGEKILNVSRPKVSTIDFVYILKQLNKERKLEKVYYDIYFQYWIGDYTEGSKQVNMLKFLTGRERLEYLTQVAAKENYNNFFFHYELGIQTVKDIPKTLRTKFNHYIQGEPLAHPKVVDPSKRGDYNLVPVQFSPDQVLEEALDAFDQMAEFCRENEIELCVYINPFPKERIQAENMDTVHDYFTGLLSRYDLPLYDMNYLRWEYFPRELQEYYDADGHMLPPLAQRYTGLLTEILTAEDPAPYFAESFPQVLASIDAWDRKAS